MTGAPTNTGILTDKEGTGFPGIRIDDKPFTVLCFVQRYLDAIPKKARVCYQITDGKVSKIWEDKTAPADEPTKAAIDKSREECNAKGNAAQEEKKDCTPSNTPALKTVEGQIVEIDKPAHKITVKTRDGQKHPFVWPPALDAEFSKLNQWWFTKVSGEHVADVDLWRATGQGFFKRPDDWPAPKGGSGGHSYQPRNERLIAFLALHRDAMSGAPISSDQDYDAVMDMVYNRAKRDVEQAFKDFGGA